MFALRRVAARALQYQPTRQLSTLRSAPLASRVEIRRPSIYRSFHQSRQLLAEEEHKQDESSAEQQGGESATVEPSAEEQKEVKEESVAEEATQMVNNATHAAEDAVSSAAQTVFDSPPRGRDAAKFPFDGSIAPSDSTKVLYIGNLFFDVTAEQLEAEFSRIGKVVNCRIIVDAQGTSKGFGFIQLASEEAAERCIKELDQKPFEGRRLVVQHHVAQPRKNRMPNQDRGQPRDNTPSKTLFIGNISYQMSDRDLNDLFREIRNVLDVRVAIDRRSGQPRGFAHADFIDVASAEKAKEVLSEKVVHGRQLRIDFSGGSRESSSSA